MPNALQSTAIELMAPTAVLDGSETVAYASRLLQESNCPMLPVTSEGRFIGVVDHSTIVQILIEGKELHEPVANYVRQHPSVATYATGAEVLRRLAGESTESAVVIDDANRVVGVITGADLVGTSHYRVPMPNIGGMATPLGVYLSCGLVKGGADRWAVALTGAVLSILYFTAAIGVEFLIRPLGWNSVNGIGALVSGPISAVIFLVALRISPLSGIHGAEHKVVTAMERGENLEKSIIRRMPRVHPRCGTNLAAGAILFVSLSTWKAIPSEEIRVILALAVTVLLWRRLGALLQQWVTTAEPSDKQLAQGIEAAMELQQNHRMTTRLSLSFAQKLISSGMIHVFLGASAGALVSYLVMLALGWGDMIKVY